MLARCWVSRGRTPSPSSAGRRGDDYHEPARADPPAERVHTVARSEGQCGHHECVLRAGVRATPGRSHLMRDQGRYPLLHPKPERATRQHAPAGARAGTATRPALLMGNEHNERAIPLEDFLSKVMTILETHPTWSRSWWNGQAAAVRGGQRRLRQRPHYAERTLRRPHLSADRFIFSAIIRRRWRRAWMVPG